jgi:hypothetical protein
MQNFATRRRLFCSSAYPPIVIPAKAGIQGKRHGTWASGCPPVILSDAAGGVEGRGHDREGTGGDLFFVRAAVTCRCHLSLGLP